MNLLEPLGLGSRTARNRIVFGPHETNLGDGRALSDRHVAYYRRRAAGGVGTVVVEEASVHGSDWPYERAPLAALAAPGWAAIASACHEEGALVIAAIGHAGGQGSSAYSQAPLWAPSRVPEVNSREVPKAMEESDIAAVVDAFADAARAAVRSGCDGVEVNAGQFSLVRQFLSGLTNHRGDEWADRPRFAAAVLAAVRAAVDEVDPGAIVGLRLSADELAPWAGIVPEAAAELAAGLSEFVSYLTVVRGSIYSASATRPDGHEAPGFNLELAASIRSAVRAARGGARDSGGAVAVIAQGSIVDVDQADRAVHAEQCDAVEMTRALLADAQLPAKFAAGQSERIRPCLLCNQACQVRDARNPIVTCVVDPRTGHEMSDHDAEAPRDSVAADEVTVIGGGVAGLEAARIAALGGHRVRLLERSDELGGMVSVAARGAGRARLGLLVEWLAAECRRLGVDVQTGVDVPLDGAAGGVGAGPVIVATGSVAAPVGYASTPGGVPVSPVASVFTAAEVLAGAELPVANDAGVEAVVVWDPIGGPIGVSVAEWLSAAGRTVVFVTPDQIVGNELARSGDLAPANNRVQQAGIAIERRTLLREVHDEEVEVEDRFSGVRRRIGFAAFVDAGHRLPDDALFTALAGTRADVARAGDAVAPRTIAEAMLDGRRAALALDGFGRLSDGVAFPLAAH